LERTDGVLGFNSLELFSFQNRFYNDSNGRFVINDEAEFGRHVVQFASPVVMTTY